MTQKDRSTLNDEPEMTEFTDEELHFLLLSVNHFKEEMKRVNEFYISTITTLDRVSAIAVLNNIHDKLIS